MVNQFLTDYQRRKQDCNDDSFFYAQPRFVHHLDKSFRARLTVLYKDEIPNTSIVLDLMSSWTSHLPENVQYKKVIGHGLNLIELEKNTRLDSFWVQNLNTNQLLPLDDSSIDVCIMTAAWQYLQYPESIASELKRVVCSNGKLIISFSNRAFWTKTPNVWLEGSDNDRIDYICSTLTSQGWNKLRIICQESTPNSFFGLFNNSGDPFFSVVAEN